MSDKQLVGLELAKACNRIERLTNSMYHRGMELIGHSPLTVTHREASRSLRLQAEALLAELETLEKNR